MGKAGRGDQLPDDPGPAALNIRISQAETGQLINATALTMICVFTAFVFGDQRVIAEHGVGPAAAVAIDAFVLRTGLVPSLIHLLGRAIRWLPDWLERILPHVSIECALPANPPPSPLGPQRTARAERTAGPHHTGVATTASRPAVVVPPSWPEPPLRQDSTSRAHSRSLCIPRALPLDLGHTRHWILRI
ncbi:hypothetical protein ADL01_36015 [Streptomyces sp. NRRL WC-3618]|uniref:MMPL family transporter n=1 Tax=Streptomyces sp. NRRL WC-3618 TaxID=1519490 RepID=UPI0006AFAD16|nr:hypothetical protein ADL01_36015 [Streptomyces sp. NRRL WC-3618]